MGKFTSFDAPTTVTAGGSTGRGASAEDMGIGAAVKGAGDNLQQIGEVVRVREDKRSITQARAGYSDARLQFDIAQEERKRTAPRGAPGFVKQTAAEYDAAMTTFTAGLNDVQLNALSGEMANGRRSTVMASLDHQSREIIKADMQDVGKIQTGLANQLAKGDITYPDAVEKFRTDLLDTTLGASAQEELHTASLPVFRKGVTDALLEVPIYALAQLDGGELDWLPQSEKNQFRTDALARLGGLKDRQGLERMAVVASSNPKALEIAFGAGTVAQLEQYRVSMDPATFNKLREIIIKRDIPVRTPQEVADATAGVHAQYTELGVKLKKGKRTSQADMNELLQFQNSVMEQAAAGFISSSVAQRYAGKIEEIVQGGISSTGTSSVDFFNLFEDDPFSVGMNAVNAEVKKSGLGAPAHGDIARRFMKLLDAAKITEGAEQTDTRDQQINALAAQAIADHHRAENPEIRHLKDVPSGFIRPNGTIAPGAPGVRDLKPDRVIGGAEKVQDKNGVYAWVVRGKDGKIIPESVQVISEAEGKLELPPIDTSTLADGSPTSQVDLPPMDLTIDDKAAAPAVADGGDIIVDQDPDPKRFSGMLDNLTPAQQAINVVSADLVANEGTGDELTDTPTGVGGITDARKAEIEQRKGRPLSDEEARNIAVKDDSAALHSRMAGFDTLDAKVQAAVLDLAYNVGINNVLNPKEFPRLQKLVAEGDVQGILYNTLNTAVVEGKSVKGLALRRARMFNAANPDPERAITAVEQLDDGTIMYMAGKRVLATFKRPRHEKSKAGITTLERAG
tara:strand:- start:1033 stop:3417 length:2385 start_codon:yes stop_codon:yes gene_type:complete